MMPPKKSKKTDNVIHVVKGSTPGTLDIEDHEVFPNSIRQVLTWKLGKSLESGDFTSFAWIDPANTSGTFDAPEISADGNSMTIGDHNGTGGRKGDLPYVITVELDGLTYTSRAVSIQGLYRDPIIINR